MVKSQSFVYVLESGRKLTAVEFIRYFEDKVFKTIRKFDLLSLEDRVVVGVSGGKDSISTLYLLHKYMKKRGVEKNLLALCIDEGIAGYRAKTLEFVKSFCLELGVELCVLKFEDLFGCSQDSAVKKLKKRKSNVSACNVCGTFRRSALNVGSRKLGATKLATGHNLDDEGQSVLLNIFKNNYKILARLGPNNGVVSDELFVPRIKPLYLCTEKEVRLYALVKGFDVPFIECPYSQDSFRRDLLNMMNELEEKHKGVKHSLVNFYLEIQGALKSKFMAEENVGGYVVTHCSVCGEPSQRKVCNTCELKKLLK